MGLFSRKQEKKAAVPETAKKTSAASASGDAPLAGAKKEAPAVPEETLLFDKTYTCPVCSATFHSKTVRTGKLKMVSQDSDLRPKYQPVDSLKYDAIACPKCGYASLQRFFQFVVPAQAKMIQENISKDFQGLKSDGHAFYTYEDAMEHHQLALKNAIVKKAKDSEKAYTCLKMAWILRGKAESLPEDAPDYQKQVEALQEKEDKMIAMAHDGFISAFSNEDFPMCGMDEVTATYLIAELALRTGKKEEASRWISKVLTSRVASDRLKDKARDLKEKLN